MDFLQNYRNAHLTLDLISQVNKRVSKPWKIMEICGGQTHAIMQFGIDQLLSPMIELVHGPGCPVCVTSLELIDQALIIAQSSNVIFTSFGDMLRVPGSKQDLFSARANGADVRVVYSPLDAVKIAQVNPDKRVVFFAIGFETTAPAIAMSVLQAQKIGLTNFLILPANVLVPPAMETILESPANKINAFLAAGHVCAVMGYWQYEPISKKKGIPIIVTGFEPLDLVLGISLAVQQLERGVNYVENAYKRVVNREGNPTAQRMISQVFNVVDRKWRGIGTIPHSGLGINSTLSHFDASQVFEINNIEVNESPLCIAGKVLQGLAKPIDCPAFGKECTPLSPLGAPMVSSEGACAAYYNFARRN
jgi:hydrogenase expression/formation protein HypD